MKKYSGIDLHSNNSVVVVADEDDRIMYQKRLANKLDEILMALAPHQEEIIGVVIESTYNWYWLVDGLMDAGYQVHLANPSAIKKYEGLKYSGDFADAAYLAHLLRLGLLPEGYIFPRELRAVRDLARKRMQLVHYRTAQILSIENIPTRETGGRMSSDRIKTMTAEGVEALGLMPDVALAMESNRIVSQALQQQIEVLEERLEAQVKLQPGYRLVKTIPVLVRYWPPRSCSRREPLRASLLLGTSAPTAAVWVACMKATARRKARAIPGTAISTWLGHSWKRRISHFVIARRPSVFTSARRAGPIASWRSSLLRTSWHGRVITSCANSDLSM